MILDDVITGLVALFGAAVAVPVYDGPVPQAVNSGDFVLVGSTGEEEDGATVDQGLSDLGPGIWIEETGEVLCSFWSWAGGTDIAARRVVAGALASACADAVAADRTLGGLLVPPGHAEVSRFRYEPRQTDTGAICRFVFTVSYRTLNT